MNAANLIATSMVIIVVDTALASGSAWAFKRLNQSYFRSKSGSGEVQQQSAFHGLAKQEFCGSASVAAGSMVHSRLETFLFFANFDEAPHAVHDGGDGVFLHSNQLSSTTLLFSTCQL
jgi:hypothetical protein